MLIVACVLSPGPIYMRSHVARLEAMVAAHMVQPYRFVCLDDSPWPGYWAKISLFEPRRFTGRVLYLDLDVTVVGPLDDLADYPGDFVAIRDYLSLTLNSSVMAWRAGIADHVHANFTPGLIGRRGGDQAYSTEQMPAAACFPRCWVPSYKVDTLRGRETPDTRVRVYHGRPKPWEMEVVA
jgi:hypothetical protein